MLTGVLPKADVLRNVQALHLLREVGEALVSAATRKPMAAASNQTMHVRLGAHPTAPIEVATVLIGTASIMHVYQPPSRLLAILHADALLHIARAMLAAAAVDRLAPPELRQVAIIGGGDGAMQMLKGLRLVRSISKATLFEPDLAANTALAFALKKALTAAVVSSNSAAEAVAEADVVVVMPGQPVPASPPKTGALLCWLNEEGTPVAPVPDWMRQASVWTDGVAQVDNVCAWTDAAYDEARDKRRVFTALNSGWLDAIAGFHVCEGLKNDERALRLEMDA
jgi:Ornithine cyclodeaminase/mu-crystallin family